MLPRLARCRPLSVWEGARAHRTGWPVQHRPLLASRGCGGRARGEQAMKAIVQREYGPPRDVLRLADVAMPVAGAEDVLVSVRASSANPWDWHFIRGEPVLLRPTGLGGVRKPKFPVSGGTVLPVV